LNASEKNVADLADLAKRIEIKALTMSFLVGHLADQKRLTWRSSRCEGAVADCRFSVLGSRLPLLKAVEVARGDETQRTRRARRRSKESVRHSQTRGTVRKAGLIHAKMLNVLKSLRFLKSLRILRGISMFSAGEGQELKRRGRRGRGENMIRRLRRLTQILGHGNLSRRKKTTDFTEDTDVYVSRPVVSWQEIVFSVQFWSRQWC